MPELDCGLYQSYGPIYRSAVELAAGSTLAIGGGSLDLWGVWHNHCQRGRLAEQPELRQLSLQVSEVGSRLVARRFAIGSGAVAAGGRTRLTRRGSFDLPVEIGDACPKIVQLGTGAVGVAGFERVDFLA